MSNKLNEAINEAITTCAESLIEAGVVDEVAAARAMAFKSLDYIDTTACADCRRETFTRFRAYLDHLLSDGTVH